MARRSGLTPTLSAPPWFGRCATWPGIQRCHPPAPGAAAPTPTPILGHPIIRHGRRVAHFLLLFISQIAGSGPQATSGKPRSPTILLWGSFAPAPIRWARARGGRICKFLSQVAFAVRSRRPQRTRAPPGFYAATEPARRTERGLAHAPNSCPSSGFSRIAYATRDTSYCGTTARSGLAGSIEAISREKDR